MTFTEKLTNFWSRIRNPLACIACLGMIAGFFYSRALLSVSVIVLFVNSLYPPTIRGYWMQWKKDRFALACMAFFGAYFISGLWSADKAEWLEIVVNKLPFVVLPFAFFSIPFARLRYRNIIIAGLFLLQLAVIVYGLSQLLLHSEAYIEGYSASQVLPTTLYNDHIRFSLSLALSLVIVCYLVFEKPAEPVPRWLLGFYLLSGISFIVYLHILAVKTGLLCLYAVAVLYVLGKLYHRHKGLAVSIVVLIAALPVLAYFAVPTFQKKADYVFLEIKNAQKKEKFNYNYSDQGRIISYKMAWFALAGDAVFGTGAGDLKAEMDKAYIQHYPGVPAKNRLIPHNQFLSTLVSVGAVLSLSLIWLCYSSFFQYPPPQLYGQITAVVMVLAFLAEAMLEIQFGIFVFLFFLLFWRHQQAGHLARPAAE